MRSILRGKPGSEALLLGNEAIARGAVEAGISLASTYPGTPASEIGDALARVASDLGFYFEYSSNEKVALELAIGASLSGLRAISSMKHVGMNVAADALMTLPYLGTEGGLTIVSADDPGCHSSQNEQDNRYYARFAGVPMLEPSDPSECLEMARVSFELSERLSLPVLLRTTTRISHAVGVVRLGEPKKAERPGRFDRERELIILPSVARRRHAELLEKLRRAEELSEDSPFNRVVQVGERSPLGIVASSAGFNYAVEAARELSLNVEILKLGFSHPLPRKKTASFLRGKERVLVVEELEPLIENELHALVDEEELEVEVLGKNTEFFSRALEYDPDIVTEAVNKALLRDPSRLMHETISPIEGLPPRPPVMCPGCPHTATYYAVRIATKGKALFPSDIGCYSLGALPPMNMADIMLCMGASISTAAGLSRSVSEPVIAFIGDSTFFHTGLPALVSAVHNGHRFMIVILDNRTTAMTGHQPHPGSDADASGEPATAVSLEEVILGCGVDEVRVIDPYDVKGSTEVIREELEKDALSVIISRRACALLEMAERGKLLGRRRSIDQDKCKRCGSCVDGLACPAISRQDDLYRIDEVLCIGCGVCDAVCPHRAIGVRR